MSVPWTSSDGQVTYPTDPFRLGNGLPAQSGVYIICKYMTPTTLLAIYVGECDNFNERLYLSLKSHHQYDCFVREGATRCACLL